MKQSRFTEEQIIGILKEHETGVSVADLCRKHGVSDATCTIPDDQITPRRSGLFMARSILRDAREGRI